MRLWYASDYRPGDLVSLLQIVRDEDGKEVAPPAAGVVELVRDGRLKLRLEGADGSTAILWLGDASGPNRAPDSVAAIALCQRDAKKFLSSAYAMAAPVAPVRRGVSYAAGWNAPAGSIPALVGSPLPRQS